MTLNFTKLVASGNDFILLDSRSKNRGLNFKDTAKRLCNRRLGIGADGLLVLEKSKKANVKMRIFNADGSEAEMCGNGARCAAYFLNPKSQIRIETRAGILFAKVNKENVKINLTSPKDIKFDLVINLNKHPLRLNLINTGVPHAVILCEGIEKIDVYHLGRLVRYHKRFKPKGTNVDFVEPKGLKSIKLRTYERGVEEETLACGTGAVASAIIYALKLMKFGLIKENNFNINVDTVSGETLKVSFKLDKNKIKDVWLEGKAKLVHKGQMKLELMKR